MLRAAPSGKHRSMQRRCGCVSGVRVTQQLASGLACTHLGAEQEARLWSREPCCHAQWLTQLVGTTLQHARGLLGRATDKPAQQPASAVATSGRPIKPYGQGRLLGGGFGLRGRGLAPQSLDGLRQPGPRQVDLHDAQVGDGARAQHGRAHGGCGGSRAGRGTFVGGRCEQQEGRSCSIGPKQPAGRQAGRQVGKRSARRAQLATAARLAPTRSRSLTTVARGDVVRDARVGADVHVHRDGGRQELLGASSLRHQQQGRAGGRRAVLKSLRKARCAPGLHTTDRDAAAVRLPPGCTHPSSPRAHCTLPERAASGTPAAGSAGEWVLGQRACGGGCSKPPRLVQARTCLRPAHGFRSRTLLMQARLAIRPSSMQCGPAKPPAQPLVT